MLGIGKAISAAFYFRKFLTIRVDKWFLTMRLMHRIFKQIV